MRYGKFSERETILFCPDHKYDGENLIKYDLDELNQLVPPYSNFAYDIIVFIGISRFFRRSNVARAHPTTADLWGITIEIKIKSGKKL